MAVREIDYRSIHEGMPIGIACHRRLEPKGPGPGASVPDAEFLSLNPEFERLTGLESELLVGKRFLSFDEGRRDEVLRWFGDFDVVLSSNARPPFFSKRSGTWCQVSSFLSGDLVVTLVVLYPSGLPQAYGMRDPTDRGLSEEELGTRMQRRMEMGSALRTALQYGEISLDYQPIVVAKTGATRGYEALMRWDSKRFGKVPPSEFIPVAENTGCIIDLGEYVLRNVCEACRKMNDGIRSITYFAVNLSTVQLMQEDFLKRFRRIVNETGVNPMFLELEITESVLVGPYEKTLEVLKSLKGMGVRIVLDDFGTGYTSLSFLRALPIDGLKIDRSYITDISIANEDKVLIGTLITLAHQLGLDVVAEGVEDSTQHNYLVLRDCDFIQGFYLRRPISDKALLSSMAMPF